MGSTPRLVWTRDHLERMYVRSYATDPRPTCREGGRQKVEVTRKNVRQKVLATCPPAQVGGNVTAVGYYVGSMVTESCHENGGLSAPELVFDIY